MSKSRRKVTVDTAKSVSDEGEKRKPSVFERLGPGGGQRKYDYDESDDGEKSQYVEKCRNWLMKGNCSFGSKCKFLHGPFTGVSGNTTATRSKRSDADNTDDLKLKLKSHRDKSGDRKRKGDGGTSDKRSHSKSKHEKEGKIKSTVVVKKLIEPESDIDSEEPEEWSDESFKNLDFKEELTLMRKRQELQRQLSILAPSEEERENLTIEKKVTSSESGSLSSSPELIKPHSKKPLKTSPVGKKKEKKKHKTSRSPIGKNKGPRTPSPSATLLVKEEKKKRHVSEEKEFGHHKNRSKKKKHKELVADADRYSEREELVNIRKKQFPEFPVKGRRNVSPKRDQQVDKQFSEIDFYPSAPKKSRHSRSPSISEKSKHKRSLSPSEKRHKYSESPVLTTALSEKNYGQEKIKLKKSGKAKDRHGASPAEKFRARSGSSEECSIHGSDKRKEKKNRTVERSGKEKSEKRDDRSQYSESAGSHHSDFKNDSPLRDWRRSLEGHQEKQPKRERIEFDFRDLLKKEFKESKKRSESPVDVKERRRHFKEERKPVSPEQQEPMHKSRRIEHFDAYSLRRAPSPIDSFCSGRAQPPSRQRGCRELSPFESLPLRDKEVPDEYRHEERPTSPAEVRLLREAGYYRESLDFLASRRAMDPLTDDNYIDYVRLDHYPSERYSYDERTRYSEEVLAAAYEADRAHFENTHRGQERDMHDPFDRLPPVRPDPRYSEVMTGKEAVAYERAAQEYREAMAMWERGARGRGRGRVVQRSRGRQENSGSLLGCGYTAPVVDRYAGLARERYGETAVGAERPNRRTDWERRRDEFYIPKRRDWPERRDERSIALEEARERPEERDVTAGLRHGARRAGWRESKREQERRNRGSRSLDLREDRWEDRRDLWNEEKPDDKVEKQMVSPLDEKMDGKRKRPREENRSRSPSLKRHREVSPVESFNSHSSIGEDKDWAHGRHKEQGNKHVDRISPILRLMEKEKKKVKESDVGSALGKEKDDEIDKIKDEDKLIWVPNVAEVPYLEGSKPLGKDRKGEKERNKEKEKGRGREKDQVSGKEEKNADTEDGALKESGGEEGSEKVKDREISKREKEKVKEQEEPVKQEGTKTWQSPTSEAEKLVKGDKPSVRLKGKKRSRSKSPACLPEEKLRKQPHFPIFRVDALDNGEAQNENREAEKGQVKKKDSSEELTIPVPHIKEENQELTFSDWSDDELADVILNRPEEPEEILCEGLQVKEDRSRRSPSRSSIGSQHSHSRLRPKERLRDGKSSSRSSSVDRHNKETERHRMESLASRMVTRMDEQLMDRSGQNNFDTEIEGIDLNKQVIQYESISSEEESLLGDGDGTKESIVNILDIDWSCVMRSSQPKTKDSSALQRFQPANIFAEIGVSKKYAGENIYNELQSLCAKHLSENRSKESASVTTDGTADIEKAKKDEVGNSFHFHHEIAAFHTAMVKRNRERTNLLHDIGPHRLAICARRDLSIRRQLCRVDKTVDQASVYPSQIIDSDLCKLSVQLLRQAQDNLRKQNAIIFKEVMCSS